jgi:hypothetical protein
VEFQPFICSQIFKVSALFFFFLSHLLCFLFCVFLSFIFLLSVSPFCAVNSLRVLVCVHRIIFLHYLPTPCSYHFTLLLLRFFSFFICFPSLLSSFLFQLASDVTPLSGQHCKLSHECKIYAGINNNWKVKFPFVPTWNILTPNLFTCQLRAKFYLQRHSGRKST